MGLRSRRRPALRVSDGPAAGLPRGLSKARLRLRVAAPTYVYAAREAGTKGHGPRAPRAARRGRLRLGAALGLVPGHGADRTSRPRRLRVLQLPGALRAARGVLLRARLLCVIADLLLGRAATGRFGPRGGGYSCPPARRIRARHARRRRDGRDRPGARADGGLGGRAGRLGRRARGLPRRARAVPRLPRRAAGLAAARRPGLAARRVVYCIPTTFAAGAARRGGAQGPPRDALPRRGRGGAPRRPGGRAPGPLRRVLRAADGAAPGAARGPARGAAGGRRRRRGPGRRGRAPALPLRGALSFSKGPTEPVDGLRHVLYT